MQLLDLPAEIVLQIASFVRVQPSDLHVHSVFRTALEPQLYKSLLWPAEASTKLPIHGLTPTKVFRLHLLFRTLLQRKDLAAHIQSFHIVGSREHAFVPANWMDDFNQVEQTRLLGMRQHILTAKESSIMCLEILDLCEPKSVCIYRHADDEMATWTFYLMAEVGLQRRAKTVSLIDLETRLQDLCDMGELEFDDRFPQLNSLRILSVRTDSVSSLTAEEFWFSGFVKTVNMPNLVKLRLMITIDTEAGDDFRTGTFLNSLLVSAQTLQVLDLSISSEPNDELDPLLQLNGMDGLDLGPPCSLVAFQQISSLNLPLSVMRLPLNTSLPPRLDQVSLSLQPTGTPDGPAILTAFDKMAALAIARPSTRVVLRVSCPNELAEVLPDAANDGGRFAHIRFQLELHEHGYHDYLFKP